MVIMNQSIVMAIIKTCEIRYTLYYENGTKENIIYFTW